MIMRSRKARAPAAVVTAHRGPIVDRFAKTLDDNAPTNSLQVILLVAAIARDRGGPDISVQAWAASSFAPATDRFLDGARQLLELGYSAAADPAGVAEAAS